MTQIRRLQGAVELKDGACSQRWDAHLVGSFQYQAQILLLQVDGETGSPIALDNLRPAIAEHPASGRARNDGVKRLLQVQTAGLSKKQRLTHA